MNRPKTILSAAVILILFVCSAGFAQANTESLSVPAGEEVVRQIGLSGEDRVQITFTVLSQPSSALHFWMVFPNATTRDYGEINQVSINFISDAQGSCEFHFDNSKSIDDELVTLNYDVERYYFGLPEIPFLIIVILAFLLCIVAGYILMGKYS